MNAADIICLQALDGVGKLFELGDFERLDSARVAGLGEAGVYGQLGDDGDAEAPRGLVYMAVAACGLVTTTTPFTGRLWKTVRGTSPVPGGMSTNM